MYWEGAGATDERMSQNVGGGWELGIERRESGKDEREKERREGGGSLEREREEREGDGGGTGGEKEYREGERGRGTEEGGG